MGKIYIHASVPLVGDILVHNSFTYTLEFDHDYDRSNDPASQLGMGMKWVPVLNELMDVPPVEYDKTKLEPVRWLADDIVEWRCTRRANQ